jgi:ribosomal protein S18 acetylase RimI-like enzyme
MHQRETLINDQFDEAVLTQGLLEQRDHVLVARHGEQIAGHLRATLLASDAFGSSAWVGPESLSYDSAFTLEALYSAQSEQWLARGAQEHYVWSAFDEISPWLDLGFALAHQRGAMNLNGVTKAEWPRGYAPRRGTLVDLDAALLLDRELDFAQQAAPSFLDPRGDARNEWVETLEDPETHYAIVERDGEPVAHCVWFPLEERVGSFARCVHLSAVSVLAEHRRLGVARAMIDHALLAARNEGFDYVETNWRVSNRRAAHYWESYGFRKTFTRLRRVIDGR